MIIRFVFQFIFFWLKVAFSCFFVMALQIMVAGKTLERHLEDVLKHSALGRQVKGMTSHQPLPPPPP